MRSPPKDINRLFRRAVAKGSGEMIFSCLHRWFLAPTLRRDYMRWQILQQALIQKAIKKRKSNERQRNSYSGIFLLKSNRVIAVLTLRPNVKQASSRPFFEN